MLRFFPQKMAMLFLSVQSSHISVMTSQMFSLLVEHSAFSKWTKVPLWMLAD